MWEVVSCLLLLFLLLLLLQQSVRRDTIVGQHVCLTYFFTCKILHYVCAAYNQILTIKKSITTQVLHTSIQGFERASQGRILIACALSVSKWRHGLHAGWDPIHYFIFIFVSIITAISFGCTSSGWFWAHQKFATHNMSCVKRFIKSQLVLGQSTYYHHTLVCWFSNSTVLLIVNSSTKHSRNQIFFL